MSGIKRAGYLRRGATVSGSYSWTRNGNPSGSVFMTVSWSDRYMELDYTSNDKPIKYRVNIKHIPAHFGGYRSYFICPSTGKRCSKLYGIGAYFLSRFAYPCAMYSKQTESKINRCAYRLFERLRATEEFLAKKYSRTTYRGRLTKRYSRLLDRREKASYSNSFERFLRRY